MTIDGRSENLEHAAVKDIEDEDGVESNEEKAMRLLEVIEDSLDPHDFTLEEIIDEYNAHVPLAYNSEAVETVCYSQDDINSLVNSGFIEPLEEKGHYHLIQPGEQYIEEV
ncbi:MAG: hypothetical protein WA057_06135 [Candidatus Magasanikiibacteriota bacterium]